MVAFGELLKELRLEAGFGLSKFADLVGMKTSNLSALEHGRRNSPDDPAKLREIAEALGLEEGTEGWGRLFDAAARHDSLPADIRHMARRSLVPALLRTIDDRQLSDDEISRLIDEIGGRREPEHAV